MGSVRTSIFGRPRHLSVHRHANGCYTLICEEPYKLIPAVSSDLLMDCFGLAWRIRELDMRASPYDLQDWGYEPVRIEEPAGRAEYTRAQKAFSEEAQVLRARILEALDCLDELGRADALPAA